MARKNTTTEARPSVPETTWPADVAPILSQVQKLLDALQIEDALALLNRTRVASPWLLNARGVCYLRQGKGADAVEVFRPLVLASGGVVLRDDVPPIFQTNYATALLIDGNLLGGRWVLDELKTQSHEALQLRNAITTWRNSLTLWQRFRWALGGDAGRPIVFNFPPGHLV